MSVNPQRRLDLYCQTQRREDQHISIINEQDPIKYRHEFQKRYAKYLQNPMTVRFGDNADPLPEPTIVKSRPIGDKNGILLPLNFPRHWSLNIEDIKKWDIPWEKKRPTAIWRGVTTGYARPYNKSPRFQLVKRWFGKNKMGIDVGFSKVVQGRTQCKKWVVPQISIEDMLKFNFIVAAEGNDVPTSLKWILASNSVLIMPKPTIETWLLESQLKPYVHYVPVKQDFSDLDKVLAWCRTHMKKCKIISNNATKYVKPFFPPKDKPCELEHLVMKRYLGLTP